MAVLIKTFMVLNSTHPSARILNLDRYYPKLFLTGTHVKSVYSFVRLCPSIPLHTRRATELV